MPDSIVDLLTEGVSGNANSLVTNGLSASLSSSGAGGGGTAMPVDPGDVNAALATLLEMLPDGSISFTSAAFRNLAPALFGMDVRFEFSLASSAQQLAAATQHVRVRVLAFRGTVPLYAPLYTASLAISSTPPTNDQWIVAVWDEEGCLSALYGPDGGATAPASGPVPYVWVKISNAPETTIERVANIAFL